MTRLLIIVSYTTENVYTISQVHASKVPKGE